MKRLIEKRDLQDQRESDLIELIYEKDINVSVEVVMASSYDELVDLIVDSKKVYVETDEETTKALKDLGFKNELKLEQYLEKFLLNKRMSLNDIVRIVAKELRIDKFYLMPTTWDETMGIDKSFIGGILQENDWYAFDIEIYYLETFTYNIGNEKNIFITEISVIKNY